MIVRQGLSLLKEASTENGSNYTLTTIPGEGKSVQDCFRDCLPGHFSTGRHEKCTPCSPGTFQPSRGQKQCMYCEKGKHQLASGKISCIECSPGTFIDVKGSPVCKTCPAGKHSLSKGSTAGSVCVDCPAGFYSFLGSVSCREVPPGSYTNVSSSSDFIKCPPGTYQTKAGQQICNITTPGYYSSSFSAVPSACKAGTYNPNTMSTNADACLPCPFGKYSIAGSSNCSYCEGMGWSLTCTQMAVYLTQMRCQMSG